MKEIQAYICDTCSFFSFSKDEMTRHEQNRKIPEIPEYLKNLKKGQWVYWIGPSAVIVHEFLGYEGYDQHHNLLVEYNDHSPLKILCPDRYTSPEDTKKLFGDEPAYYEEEKEKFSVYRYEVIKVTTPAKSLKNILDYDLFAVNHDEPFLCVYYQYNYTEKYTEEQINSIKLMAKRWKEACLAFNLEPNPELADWWKPMPQSCRYIFLQGLT